MTAYSIKEKKKKDELKEGVLSKKGIRLKDLENSQSDYFAKKEKKNIKACSEENTKSKAGQSIKDIMEL